MIHFVVIKWCNFATSLMTSLETNLKSLANAYSLIVVVVIKKQYYFSVSCWFRQKTQTTGIRKFHSKSNLSHKRDKADYCLQETSLELWKKKQNLPKTPVVCPQLYTEHLLRCTVVSCDTDIASHKITSTLFRKYIVQLHLKILASSFTDSGNLSC